MLAHARHVRRALVDVRPTPGAPGHPRNTRRLARPLAEPIIERIADRLRDRGAAITATPTLVQDWATQVDGSVDGQSAGQLAADLITLASRGRDREWLAGPRGRGTAPPAPAARGGGSAAGGYHHHLDMNIWSSRGAGPRAARLGLGNLAITVPSRDDLDAITARLRARGWVWTSTGLGRDTGIPATRT